jgi:hypothetical protein
MRPVALSLALRAAAVGVCRAQAREHLDGDGSRGMHRLHRLSLGARREMLRLTAGGADSDRMFLSAAAPVHAVLYSPAFRPCTRDTSQAREWYSKVSDEFATISAANDCTHRRAYQVLLKPQQARGSRSLLL